MEFTHEENRIRLYDAAGNTLAEVTFPETAEGAVNISHTFVDDSLRGQGVAGQLLTACADRLRSEGKKAVLTCSYAVKWFASHPEYADILAENA